MLQKVDGKTALSDTAHSVSKDLVSLYIPAFASLYYGLAKIWDLPYAEQVVGTLALVATFLGIVLKVSTANYNAAGGGIDGDVVATTTTDGGLSYSLNFNGDPADIQNMDKVTFKVVHGDSPQEPEIPAVEPPTDQ